MDDAQATPTTVPIEFLIRIQPNLKPILILFGVRDDGKARVRLADGQFTARFGRFEARTPLANIERWDIGGPYKSWRAVGVRRTMGTHDLSFGGSAHGAVRLHFREPVRAARLMNTELYVSVDDLLGLGAALTERGVPGQDDRVRP
ncbi:MAG TPA: hypothetical protein VF323_09745 [Candidatus Limnocylindrales bacterium]